MPPQLSFDIQVEIINRLPVKSLLQFRSVCKAWKSHFIAGYNAPPDQPQHLMITYRSGLENITDGFKEVHLPESLRRAILSISRLRESLVLLEDDINFTTRKQVCNVWMMEHGHQQVFTKLYTVKAPSPDASFFWTIGFRNNGEAIIAVNDDEEDEHMFSQSALVYDPCLEHIKDLGIRGNRGLLNVNSYTESLLLLNHDDGHIAFYFDKPYKQTDNIPQNQNVTSIPLEIELEVLKRLPVKSLIRLTSTCKAWKSMIECSEFIAESAPHSLTIYLCGTKSEIGKKTVCFVDDDTFPQQKFDPTFPSLVQPLYSYDSCQGLLCFYGSLPELDDSKTNMIVLWNPSIRKSIDVVVTNLTKQWSLSNVLGFGVCPYTKDPKIVKITYVDDHENPCQVMVFTIEVRGMEMFI
ncbi:LOW QUALITY PROTEIN: hypothetical protein OSB04_028938 [Centaurea solstitialis]|uniref:F-box domain-containing protein n=1 Tax=Centaurea solstitialis TaxID=347529 RepID=A0AA38W147_9ASTR|nr:LOW QUALITY PROTEIN: hypothetical protein OSB04_028938 [Centaurea solstitialis]